MRASERPSLKHYAMKLFHTKIKSILVLAVCGSNSNQTRFGHCAVSGPQPFFSVFFWDSSLFSKHEIGEGATFFSAFRRYVMRLFCIALMVKHFFSNWLVICRVGSTKGERVFLFLLRCNICYVAATCDLFFAATCDLFFKFFLRCNIRYVAATCDLLFLLCVTATCGLFCITLMVKHFFGLQHFWRKKVFRLDCNSFLFFCSSVTVLLYPTTATA